MGKLTRAFEKSSSQKRQAETSALPRPNETYTPSNAGVSIVAGQGGPNTFGLPNDERWDERLRLSTDPHSQIFESFRSLRARLLYSESGQNPRTLLITSVMPGEGKGFVCANLGIVLSQDIEHHALMLDCDFRRPSLARLFGLGNETGLVDYLQDSVDLSLLIRKTGQPKLSLLPSGRPPRNPSELLSSSRMISFVEAAKDRYQDRIVIFDSAPSHFASETRVLAKHIDGVILVVRHGMAKKEDVKKFVDAIGSEKILGLVYNGCPEDKIGAFLNRRYGYGHYYYY
ncbi:MAG: polysaccharide biosynthesis tyrosine autokinase [Desulfobacterales bacterium]|nr:polysaccharide biosynthesis tyrosine autokinase [Desulfobacterales bacterium]